MGLQVDIEKIAKRPRNPFRQKVHLWFRDISNSFNFGWFLTIFYYHDILPFLRKISRDSGFYKAKKYRLLIILWRPKSPHIWRIPNDKQYIVLSWDICHLWGVFRQNKKYFYFIFHLQIAYCMRPVREFSKKKKRVYSWNMKGLKIYTTRLKESKFSPRQRANTFSFL